jgi:WD40 repeat protein
MRRVLLGFIFAAAAYAGPFVVGDVFASVGDGKVRVYDQNGVFKQELDTTVGGYTTGSTFDKVGNFYVTAFSNNTVVQFDANGGLINTAWSSGFGAANESIVFNQAGNAYIGYAGAASVREVDPTGAHVASYAVNQNTDWIDLGADQNTLFYSNEGNTIAMWDVGTNTDLGVFTTGSGPFFAKRVRPGSGELLVASGDGFVYRFDSAGNQIDSYASGIGAVFALNLDPDGTSFWTGALGGQNIIKVDIATGAILESWSTGVGQLYGLSVLGEIQAGGGGVGGGGQVPEPSTGLLIVGGLATLVAFRRRFVR